MRRFLLIFLLVAASFGAAFLLTKENKTTLAPTNLEDGSVVELPNIPEAESAKVAKPVTSNKDIEPQKALSNPPAVIKAVYVTSWSAGTPSKINHIIDLVNTTEVNAVVIDIKDYSGYVAYNTDIKALEEYGAEEIRIPKLNSSAPYSSRAFMSVL